MSTTVFILGAGASFEGGAPLMNNFLDVAHSLWKMGKVARYQESFEILFSAISNLQKVHSKAELDIHNVESVFGAFEMAKTLGGFAGLSRDEIEVVISSMRKVIVQTVEQTLTFPIKKGKEIGHIHPPVPYEAFATLLARLKNDSKPPQTVSVLTFNYDLGIDYALYSKGVAHTYAVEESGNSGIPLLKLHGSTNWYRCRACDKVIPVTMHAYFNRYHWNTYALPEQSLSTTLPFSENLIQFISCDHPGEIETAIVPPTWNKTDYHRQIASVWGRAARELSEAENIICIGYSLPDTDYFFRNLYQLGTVGNALLKRFWVFDPDKSGVVEQRFRGLLGPGARARFSWKSATFAESIPEIEGAFIR